MSVRTREVRKMRERVYEACESFYFLLSGEVFFGGDDYRLGEGSLTKRGDAAREVQFRLERAVAAWAEVARKLSDACKVGHRTGGYAKRRVVAAEAAVKALRDARAST